ncbi:hypothetical protein [Sphingomonas bacterium]|uniref:hypothetical protein n=1 Tax=Sphingomonas bacterium TaxID=1895847 RepID=UPI0020C60B45|nr:hypothetical protein [Sphingomonas bacterium]
MIRRIRVGLTGLACVFLLVMLATALISMAGERGGGNLTAAAPNEPLAQLGVVPGNPAAPSAPAPKASKHN